MRKSSSPWALFRSWYQEARKSGEPDIDAIALATATGSGKPSVRMVLFKGMSQGGPTFFTNYESRKGRELADNPRAALLFYWPRLKRQVRIEGTARRLSRKASSAYFQTRPRGSQLSAWVSRQSRVIPDGKLVRQRILAVENRYAGREIPCPEHWGGFRLDPGTIEFWEERPDRFHERLQFQRRGRKWSRKRLWP